MKLLLSLFTLVICVTGAIGQSSAGQACTDKTVENISSRGIKIGANAELLKSTFDLQESSSLVRKEVGSETLSVRPRPEKERFQGISSYRFDFLDGQLVSYLVSYAKPNWLDLSQYVSKVVELFDLPSIENWSVDGPRATLLCGNYELTAVIEGGQSSYFAINDKRLDETLAARKKKLEDQQMESDIRAFKP